MKDYFSSKFKDLLCGMLEKDPRTRWTLARVKQHPFFDKNSFDDILKKKTKPPSKPTVKTGDDLRNFDPKVLTEDVLQGSPQQENRRKVTQADMMHKFQ